MEPLVLVPPPVEPITVEDAFVELRLGMPGDDFRAHPDYRAVRAKMRAATRACEDLTQSAFVLQTLRLVGTPDALSAAARRRSGLYWQDAGFDLPREPVQAIVAVSYLDPLHVAQPVDPADYYLVAGGPPQLFFSAGYALPALADRRDALRIDYLAGYPPGLPDADYDPEDPPQHLAANVPEPIAQAVLLTLRMLYENLSPDDRGAIERARDILLSPYRLLSV